MQYSNAAYQRIIEATRSFSPKQRLGELTSLKNALERSPHTLEISNGKGVKRVYELTDKEKVVYHEQIESAIRHANYCVGLFE